MIKNKTKVILVIITLCILMVTLISIYRFSSKHKTAKSQESQSEESSLNDATSNEVNSTPCDQDLWHHIYNPDRLKIISCSLTATGIVEFVRQEKDGDKHILLRLDPGQEKLLNEKNYTSQHGDLVIEPIYVDRVTQTDAINESIGYINKLTMPRIGDHISVTGTHVLDRQHGWNEIHPVSNITIDDSNFPVQSIESIDSIGQNGNFTSTPSK